MWRWALKILLGIVASSLLICIFGAVVLTLGYKSGQEFSPDLLERRSFSYYSIPFVGKQISKVSRVTSTETTESFLLRNQYVAANITEPTRWHLLQDWRTDPLSSSDLDCHILCDYLDEKGANGLRHWVNWTNSETEKGKIFWPLVFELARENCYLDIPEMFELCEREGLSLSEYTDQLESIFLQSLFDRAEYIAATQDADQGLEYVDHISKDLSQYLSSDRKTAFLKAKVKILKSAERTSEARTLERELRSLEEKEKVSE